MVALSVLAVAAPQFQSGVVGSQALSSADPASLYNACRVAGDLARRGVGAWGNSNWAESRAARRGSVILLNSMDDSVVMATELSRLKPNLVLMGAMTICLPGAVACARLVKQCLGDNVLVVLGGRHACETMYRDHTGQVAHHASSPIRLIAEQRIEPVFDVVISGDGEHVVAALGEIVDESLRTGHTAVCAREHIGRLAPCGGRWIAATWIDGQGATVMGDTPLDHNSMPSPCAVFGIGTVFDVFDGRPTAHVFSDSGRGCVYDCGYCSERRSVTGAPSLIQTGADRLARQLTDAVDVVQADHPGSEASAFVEDSILLAGSPHAMDRLYELLVRNGPSIQFGAQLTVDQVLARREPIERLASVGLKYLFIGVETLAPAGVGGLHKDIGRRTASWGSRCESAFEQMAELGITCGAALLFGMGEGHSQRLALLENIGRWHRRFRLPGPISLNWAVQHPLNGRDSDTQYRYTEWATPDGPFLCAFRHFGEASVLYPLGGQPPPVLDEVTEVCQCAGVVAETSATEPIVVHSRAIRRALELEKEEPVDRE